MDERRLSDYEPGAIENAIVSLGEEYADLDAAATLLEETKSVLKAKLALESTGKSAAEREMMALAQPAFSEHLSSMVEARRLAIRARVKWETKKLKFEAMRSIEATKRGELMQR